MCLESFTTIFHTDFHNVGEEFTFWPGGGHREFKLQQSCPLGSMNVPHNLMTICQLKYHISHVKGKKMCPEDGARGKVTKKPLGKSLDQ